MTHNSRMPGTVFRLVACDDHPPIRMALRLTLRNLHPGAQMHEAGTGHELLALLAKPVHYDLVTLDVNLPDMPALELLQQVKTLRPTLPVLVLSADDDPRTVMTMLEHGASGYITKTSPEDVLIRALESAFHGGITLPHTEAAAPPCAQDAQQALAGLSPRQRQVLKCLLKGMSGKQIAKSLDISEGTTKDHTVAVFRHLNVNSRTLVLVEAQRRGIPLDFEP
ncbi:MAG: response regulator transcription factor [Hylemonella sp.]|nr:response regulator transcription factor [Hylemonella sp.]